MKYPYSTNWQLGFAIADSLIANQLPTLETDAIKTRKVIPVPEDLKKEWDVKEKHNYKLFIEDSPKREEVFYENLKWYKKNIEDKFLDDEVTMTYKMKIVPENYEEFADGFETALWECDCSHYKFLKIGRTDKHVTDFILIRDNN